MSERFPQQSLTKKTNRMTQYGQESHHKVLGSGLVRLGSWRLIFLEAFTVGFAVLSGRNSAARKRSSLYLPCRSWRFLVRQVTRRSTTLNPPFMLRRFLIGWMPSLSKVPGALLSNVLGSYNGSVLFIPGEWSKNL